MKTSHISLWCIATILCSLFACQSKNGSANQAEEGSDTVVVELVNLNDDYHLLSDTANPICKVSMKLNIPVQYGEPGDYMRLQKMLTPLIFGEEYTGDSILQAAQKVTKAYLKEYKDLEAEYRETAKEGESFSFQWNIEYSIGPRFNRDRFITYLSSTQSYMGGAHGSYNDYYWVIDLENWVRLGLDDIFRPESIDHINALLLDKLLKDKKLTTPEELLHSGYFDPETIEATDNFYLTDNGMGWLYNPYEIASYTNGQTHIELSFDELEPYILADSPIRRLIP